MILTTCAACAAPLAHDAPRCVRCKSRYVIGHARWTTGAAYKQMLRKYTAAATQSGNADKKYKEAVAEAVEACAEDTKGQAC